MSVHVCMRVSVCWAGGWGLCGATGATGPCATSRVCVFGDGTPPSWTSVSPSAREGARWKPPGNLRIMVLSSLCRWQVFCRRTRAATQWKRLARHSSPPAPTEHQASSSRGPLAGQRQGSHTGLCGASLPLTNSTSRVFGPRSRRAQGRTALPTQPRDSGGGGESSLVEVFRAHVHCATRSSLCLATSGRLGQEPGSWGQTC